MTISVNEAIRQIDSGEAHPLAFQRIRQYLSSVKGRDDDLYNAVSAYLEEAPVIDWRIALKFVRYPEDPLVASAAIGAASLRRCPDQAFWSAVEGVAAGETWDSMDDARIQAILALNRNPFLCTEKVKALLRASLKDRSASVRDSAAIAAQRCFGIPENEVVAHGVGGKLIERLPKQVLEWLDSD